MESKIKFKPNPEYRLMDQVREVLRYYHYAYSTEQSYSSWILQYIKFYGACRCENHRNIYPCHEKRYRFC
ncbi:MAG: phage integrase N-terminal SAM-like domain-containing protein [Proteobacteria bacterium]|nr:phage integrase N-terminal SAM-like domain-containing protein [Pseudomonadota bacterium]